MDCLAHIAYLVATDEAFRRALSADPEAALAAHGLTLSADEKVVLASMQQILQLPSEELATLRLTAEGPTWGGMPPESPEPQEPSAPAEPAEPPEPSEAPAPDTGV